MTAADSSISVAGTPADRNVRVAPGGVTTPKLADGAVTGAKVAVPLTLSGESVSPIVAAFNRHIGEGVFGRSARGTGVVGVGLDGVRGEALQVDGWGVLGSAPNGPRAVGVFGTSNAGTGVRGGGVIGVSGTSGVENGRGVVGVANIGTNAMGVSGRSTSGDGVVGETGAADPRAGVLGTANALNGNGVVGIAETGSGSRGVLGRSVGGIGVRGIGNSGVWGMQIGTGWAGLFQGNVEVTGTLSKGGGSFKIDHPLDPANKYLYHSFVESPDMMNVYNGNVTLDVNGEAALELPEWFGVLNRDFRYQLTALGAPGPNLYIAEKVSNNRFKIAGGTPGLEVSWQVTGIRQDAWANAHRIPVEENKPASERGFYLHPELFSAPEEKGVEWAHHPDLMKRLKEERTKLPAEPRP